MSDEILQKNDAGILSQIINGIESLLNFSALKPGIDPNNRVDEYEHTPLQLAVRTGKPHVILHWIERGANVNDTGRDGEIALHAAARRGYPHCLKLLLEMGSPVNALSSKGCTPLHWVGHSWESQSNKDQLKACARILVQYGADLDIDNGYCTPRKLLAERFGIDFVAELDLLAKNKKAFLEKVATSEFAKFLLEDPSLLTSKNYNLFPRDLVPLVASFVMGKPIAPYWLEVERQQIESAARGVDLSAQPSEMDWSRSTMSQAFI